MIPAPEKVLCVGVNYVAHRQETGRAESAYPTLFTRFTNTLTPHGAPLVRPRASAQFDFEGEMAVVIGRRGRHIAREDALAHVGGYTCFNDATLRDWQRHTTQFTPGKNFVATAGVGPWITTADELPDPAQSEVSLTVNGAEMQRSTTDLLIFDVPALIAYISTFTELAPGDLIATGTPGGVGWKREPPVFLRAGDVVEVTVRGVGTLRNVVADEG
ncbi:MAG: fumarylacetoacetate hydrolase family protein [Polyangiales bacterium]